MTMVSPDDVPVAHNGKVLAEDFDLRNRDDEQIQKTVSVETVIDAILSMPDLPADLAERLRKWCELTDNDVDRVLSVTKKAIYTIPTLKGYIVNAYLDRATTGQLRFCVGAIGLPFAKTQDGNVHLCMDFHRPVGGLHCQLRVLRLPVGNVYRSVVVSGHASDRIAKRAGIRGSFVAFIAGAVDQTRPVAIQEGSRGPVLVLRAGDGNLLGYCPIDEVECSLERRGKDNVCGALSEHLLVKQRRWLLKTFLEPSMITLVPDGVPSHGQGNRM